MPDNCTSLPLSHNAVGLDWVRFSFTTFSWPFIQALLDASDEPGDWLDGPRYRRKFFTVPLEGILVAADHLPTRDGLPGERFSVDFSGNGLAHYFTKHSSWATLYGFFEACLKQPDVRVNRLDIALDCFDASLLTVRKAERYRQRGQILTRLRKYNFMNSEVSPTLYLGSRNSEAFVRVYDKRLLELSRQREDDADELPGHWVRLEVELKEKKALAAAAKMYAGQFHPHTLAGIIRSVLDFLSPNDSNKQRAKPARWWYSLTFSASKVPVRVPKPVRSLDKKKVWVKKTVAPTLALILEDQGGDMTWFYDAISEGRDRLRPDQLALLQSVTHGA